MSQTVLGSIVEAKTNIAVGFTINYFANLVILPMVGMTNVTATNAFLAGLLFTVVSIARQFVIRRWFNGMKWDKKAEEA